MFFVNVTKLLQRIPRKSHSPVLTMNFNTFSRSYKIHNILQTYTFINAIFTVPKSKRSRINTLTHEINIFYNILVF